MSSASLRIFALRAAATLGVVALAACSTETTVAPTGSVRGPSLDVVNQPGGAAPTQAEVQLCKWSHNTDAVTINVTTSGANVSGPTAVVFHPAPNGSLSFGYTTSDCQYVLASSVAGTTTVSMTETIPAGQTLASLLVNGFGESQSTDLASATATVTLHVGQGAIVYFKNDGETTVTGCTYTQGYWKTHSTAGPAAHADGAWLTVTGSASGGTRFSTSFNGYAYFGTKTWLQIFNTAPKGDAKYILADQFMAAYLNVNKTNAPATLTGATLTAYNNALAYFNGTLGYTPTDTTLKAWAATLDTFNNGGPTGAGHCGDEVVASV